MFDIVFFGLVFLIIAFFSSAEIAYSALNNSSLDHLKKTKIPFIHLANKLLGESKKTLLNITLGSVFSLYIFAYYISRHWIFYPLNWSNAILDVLMLIIASLFVIISAKIFPKIIIRHFSEYTAIAVSPFLLGFKILFYPLSTFIEQILKKVGQKNAPVDPSKQLFYKLDFETLQSDFFQKTAINQDKKILSDIFSIADILVKESMVPRTEIHGVSIKTPIKEVHQEFITTGYSQLPVFENTIDNIVGIVNVHDLFKRPLSIEEIIKEVIYVPERKKSVELLKEFVIHQKKSAIVVDEFGGTAGLVTSEDLIEELLGDIQDEYDSEDDICRALSNNTFLISGRINIDTINEKFELGIPKEENYETLAGFILNKIGKIPKAGDSYQIDRLMINILRSTKTKIEIVKIKMVQ